MPGSIRKSFGPICGARNRRGEPCQCKLLLKGGKCRFHGGLSTGSRTPEGRQRQIEANRRRKGEKRSKYTRKPKITAPTPEQRKAEYWGRLYAEIAALEQARRLEEARDPERLEFWRQAVRDEFQACGAPTHSTPKEAASHRREVTILAVQRRRAWLDGELELIDITHPEKEQS